MNNAEDMIWVFKIEKYLNLDHLIIVCKCFVTLIYILSCKAYINFGDDDFKKIITIMAHNKKIHTQIPYTI